MLLRKIDELETFFKWLDRANLLVFNVWNDKQADAYKNGAMLQMETLYRTYIADMRQIANELSLMQKQIEEEKLEIERLEREIRELKDQPSIAGCYKVDVVGRINEYEAATDTFAVAPDEVSHYQDLVYERIRRVKMIEDVSLAGAL